MARSQKRQDQTETKKMERKRRDVIGIRKERHTRHKLVTITIRSSAHHRAASVSTAQHNTTQHNTTQHTSHGHPHARPLCGDGALAREGFRLARRPSLLSNAAIADAIAIAITNTTQISIDAHHRLHASHYHCHYHIHATSISHATA